MTNLPKNGAAFERFMQQVWDAPCTPAKGGGTVIHQSPLYDEFHDARVAAERSGAKRTGTTKVDGEDWLVYRFPADEGCVSVRVKPDGSAIDVGKHRFSRHTRKVVAGMVLALALFAAPYPADAQGYVINRTCFGRTCATIVAPLSNPHVRHVPGPTSPEDAAAAAERDARWAERCRPAIRHDALGVPRYAYARPGCEFGAGY